MKRTRKSLAIFTNFALFRVYFRGTPLHHRGTKLWVQSVLILEQQEQRLILDHIFKAKIDLSTNNYDTLENSAKNQSSAQT